MKTGKDEERQYLSGKVLMKDEKYRDAFPS